MSAPLRVRHRKTPTVVPNPEAESEFSVGRIRIIFYSSILQLYRNQVEKVCSVDPKVWLCPLQNTTK